MRCTCCYSKTDKFVAAVIGTEGGLPLWSEIYMYVLIDEPLTSAVFEYVARRTARTTTNAVRVQGFGGIVQLNCVWLA